MEDTEIFLGRGAPPPFSVDTRTPIRPPRDSLWWRWEEGKEPVPVGVSTCTLLDDQTHTDTHTRTTQRGVFAAAPLRGSLDVLRGDGEEGLASRASPMSDAPTHVPELGAPSSSLALLVTVSEFRGLHHRTFLPLTQCFYENCYSPDGPLTSHQATNKTPRKVRSFLNWSLQVPSISKSGPSGEWTPRAPPRAAPFLGPFFSRPRPARGPRSARDNNRSEAVGYSGARGFSPPLSLVRRSRPLDSPCCKNICERLY